MSRDRRWFPQGGAARIVHEPGGGLIEPLSYTPSIFAPMIDRIDATDVMGAVLLAMAPASWVLELPLRVEVQPAGSMKVQLT